jgi:predicted alpha/beta superfamily hydrolase
MRFRILTMIAAIALINGHTIAQSKRVDIPGSEVKTIHSSIVNQDYELHILLPGGHASGNKKYPVVYLLDSQWDFPLVKSLYGQQYYDGFIPELIVVGITWSGPHANADSLRARDYTPTKEARLPQSGGAANFLSFMQKELFPFIEGNYKADPQHRTLMGCSLGGLMTLYALFTATDLFEGYVAASPAYGWDRAVIYQYEQKWFDKKDATAARLYMTMGDVERGLPGYEQLVSHLQKRNYSKLAMRSRVLENTGHSGTKAEGFSRGLQYVFEKPVIQLNEQLLRSYSGTYTLANGGTVELKTENDQLVLYFGSNNRFQLYASNDSDLYAKSEFLTIHFTANTGVVDGFQLNRYGNSQYAKKK